VIVRKFREGVILIVIGLILLANTLGYLDWSFWEHLIDLWPLALIAAGIAILIKAFSQKEVVDESE